MDERKIDAATPQVPQFLEPPAPESRFRTVGQTGIRIDGQHANASERTVEADSAIPTVASAAGARPNSKLLADAGLLLQQMLERETDLELREATIEQRLSELEADRLRFQSLRIQQFEELEQNRLRLQSEEATLRERMVAAEELLKRIEVARLAAERERIDVERRRASLREEVLAELQLERQAIETERNELATEHERARALTASLEEQHRQATVEAERLIQSERERLWQTLIGEWEERRSQFQTEHDQWLATSQAEKQEIEREKAFYDAAVREAESDFAAARATQAAELQVTREQHLALLEAERQQHTITLRAERDEWQQRRAASESELFAQRDRELATLQSQREEWDRTYTVQRAELHSERSVLESRIRFQQEHLEKLRTDLERAQNEHRHERQVERQHLEESSQLLLKRMRQIDLYRASVEEREKSLERERNVLSKSRRALSSTSDLDRISLQAERDAWEHERQIQQAELRRQQDLLTSHSENLESRRIRLDKLRAELEDTHRSTLEMRLAVEETWVDLTQSAGQDEARLRVDQVRHALVGYYSQLHEGLVEQRREHLDAQSKFERLRTEFLDERQKLMDWIAARDNELRVAEERLRIATADSTTRDSAWQAARDRWLLEKTEAEQVIRKLLIELGIQHRDAPANAGGMSPSAMMAESALVNHLSANPPVSNDRESQVILDEDR
ncbi:MAG: hypothetical protein AABP62_09365 [Planctomycetota bacterium]